MLLNKSTAVGQRSTKRIDKELEEHTDVNNITSTLRNPNTIYSPSVCDDNARTEENASNEVSASEASPLPQRIMG